MTTETSTGRLLFGDVSKPQPKLDDNKQPVLDKVTGQPVMEYVVGVGFAKNDPAQMATIEALRTQDRAAWPQFFGADGNLLPGVNFADKFYDGDGHDTKGRPYASRDGWAGHTVVKFSSQFAPGVYAWDGRQWAQTTDYPKPGDYIRVGYTTASNMQTAANRKSGMYRNLNMIAMIGKGTPIVVGADANEVFGAAPALPPGASVTPVAPSAPVPGAVAAPAAPPATPAPPAPPPAPAAPASPSEPRYQMTASAGGSDRAAFVAAGWTDEQLLAAGHMVRI